MSFCKNEWGNRILYQIIEEDAQLLAQKRIGRKLTDDELYQVKKGIEWGMECWTIVVNTAIDIAVQKS